MCGAESYTTHKGGTVLPRNGFTVLYKDEDGSLIGGGASTRSTRTRYTGLVSKKGPARKITRRILGSVWFLVSGDLLGLRL